MAEDDLKNVKSFVCDLNIEDVEEKSELKNFLFGRNILENGKHSESIFEKVLATPDAGELVEIIWKTFDLFTTEDILSLVREIVHYYLNGSIDN